MDDNIRAWLQKLYIWPQNLSFEIADSKSSLSTLDATWVSPTQLLGDRLPHHFRFLPPRGSGNFLDLLLPLQGNLTDHPAIQLRIIGPQR